MIINRPNKPFDATFFKIAKDSGCPNIFINNH